MFVCLWVEGLSGGAGWRMLDIPLWTMRSSSWSLHFENEATVVNEHLQYGSIRGFIEHAEICQFNKHGIWGWGMGQWLLYRIDPGVRVQGFYNNSHGAHLHIMLRISTSVLEKKIKN